MIPNSLNEKLKDEGKSLKCHVGGKIGGNIDAYKENSLKNLQSLLNLNDSEFIK